MGLIPKEIEAHYLESGESERLSSEWGELERLRTQAILSRYLAAAPRVILDVGGAAGVYAFPLATQGYQVHLVDPVELHLEQARSFAASSGVRLASMTQGDARHLDFPATSVDAVLLLGPLYHLVERSDRERALQEARRVLKPRGVLFAAAISRFASLIDGIARGFFRDEDFRKIVGGDLSSGRHQNPTSEAAYFTTAYFHHPDELADEMKQAGFRDVRVLAIEGPVWSGAFFREVWNNPEQREELLKILASIEAEPSLLGASAHLLGVGFPPA